MDILTLHMEVIRTAQTQIPTFVAGVLTHEMAYLKVLLLTKTQLATLYRIIALIWNSRICIQRTLAYYGQLM